MKVRVGNQNTIATLVGITLLAILLFLLIPFSYGITLPFVYWVNQFMFFVMMVSLTFVNTKWLAPEYLFHKQYFQYYLILFGFCILIIILLKQTETLLNLSHEIKKSFSENGGKQKHGGALAIFFYIFLIQILVLGVNIAGILITKWQDEKNLRLQVEKDKIEMELSFLKSQINPHFFFNSLNTVNALTYTDVSQSRVALKKLGTIMRYVLYNTSSKNATLGEEIEFIENYLDLMRMRTSQRVSIVYSSNVKHLNSKISPMLFLPFIENCFKHGVSTQVESPIEIKITEDGDDIVFYAKNNLFDRTYQADVEGSHGIGIQNTKRRLELLYKNKYELNIQNKSVFEVFLKINLNEN